jgi:DNA topoisomerase I
MKRRLHYANDSVPGITRSTGSVLTYRYPNGRKVRAARQLQRVAALGIPPAWTDVWICPDGRGHLQATGRDARRRKQYLYHADWVAERDSNKFSALARFAAVLPRLRRVVRRDLARPALCKERVLAAVVHLMDRACIRVGNDRYRRENGSFGLTTLRERHVRARGAAVILDFRGKSGKQHHIEVADAALAHVVRDCLDLPGQVLFRYEDHDGVHALSAQDVNDYLRSIARVPVTSKDFRTWGGTVCAAAFLSKCGSPSDLKARGRNLRAAVNAAAERLGNTPAVCRRSYIHPKVFESYGRRAAVDGPAGGLRKDERIALAILRATARPRRAQAAGARTPVRVQRPTRVNSAPLVAGSP